MSTLEDIKKYFPPIHRAGYPFIVIFLLVTLLLFMIWSPLGCIGLILTGWCVYFFRDPNRVVLLSDDYIVSPSDGVICQIERSLPPDELKLETKELVKISIFLNLFNVHVNRIPCNGKIVDICYNPGAFFNASLDKASKDNERQVVLLETPGEKQVVFAQIAGLIARRIICNLKKGEDVNIGERYGIIRFGSRVDVYLPEGVEPTVCKGQTVIGGETILANMNHNTDSVECKLC